MITLTLLHPLQSVPVQTWTFEPQPLIRIGRSRRNEVTLFSAVVSRHHVELRRKGLEWELVNVGSNGTFTQGKRVSRAPVINGMIVRLASSGPQIQIWTKPQENPGRKRTLVGSGRRTTHVGGAEDRPARTLRERRRSISREELQRAKETQVEDPS
ncbi:FHA domain protein [Rubidibacter lacunae KORDI 51-2]|uniref:FHA domain protein n=1 Tax=Rubidibacter lacunae KORDI 51-2 TaxID=582515 RepID=U5DKR0_9CHRO|nr:FHA domain-containing protein [Rubidibacter lacunae]ERN42276.1 FHA domain protein [Rubidibacter lacunae KORDI 51-2]